MGAGRGKGKPFEKGNKASARMGRPKGTPNRATREAREAIAMFVDKNAHRLQKWLDEVADGKTITETDDKGNEVERYIVTPDPEKAFVLFQSVIEYHVPKLARTEVTGKDGGPVVVAVNETDRRL